ncbi:uncharacterized protein LOC135831688 [Planococcus citri]|uniref:uncharacterized protein LOC135831688 n=1 Tax=Planococcus citri TaxID=170843 RepID=UPI0031F92EAB
MKSNIATNVLFVLLAFNGKSNPSIHAATKQIYDTFSFLCQDQMVKVGSNIYHLDRLNSSLKSEFFEKLFTSEDFKRKNDPILEIQPLNSEVFPAILEIIHGKEIQYVINKDNYLSLLKELNHFGMRIDLQIFSSFIDYDLESCSPQEAKIFELYTFILQNSQFEYLSRSVLKYLSNHLDALQNHEILSSEVPADHLVQLIENVNHPNESARYRVVQICSEWLCHDMKNRLPHMAELVKKTKLLHRDSEEMYSDFSKCLPSCDLDKQARRKMISTCFFALVANGGRFYPTTTKEYTSDNYNEYPSEDSNDESETENEQYNGYCVANDRNDCVKLNEFRKNGDLYDITVRVGEKTCKLHRRILESKSGYFRDIFRAEYSDAVAQFDETPKTCPSKDEEYIISDEIDPSTFEEVISSLYGYENLYAIFNRFEYKWDKIVKFLKTAHSLKLGELLQDCVHNLNEEYWRANLQDVEQFLNFAHGKPEYDNLYVIHLSKHLTKNWPNIGNMSQIGYISLPMLKEMLNSWYFRLNDPHKIVDICSKWTCHDVKGRYQYLPQIARVINPLCAVEDDEYTTDPVAEFNTSPEKFVRDKLWKILSSLSYNIYSEKHFKNASRKLEEIPVFISVVQRENEIDVLNADLDVITSINDFGRIHLSWRRSVGQDKPLSATLINDILFILCNLGDSYKFMAYNFFLKTCIQLRSDLPSPGWSGYVPYYTLLNCNNEIYGCSIYGQIAKYSMQFDLWTTLIKEDPLVYSYIENVHYTSDGKTLYRIYGIDRYYVQGMDFAKNSWDHVPGSPLTKNFNSVPIRFSMINDRDFIILAYGKIMTSNRDVTGEEWHWSYREVPKKTVRSIAPYEDKLLVLTNDEFYSYYPNNGSFVFKKTIATDLLLYSTHHIVPIDRHVLISVGTQVRNSSSS